jgi:hypothetical protein
MPTTIQYNPNVVADTRIPDNINPLQSNGFMLNIQRLPKVKYFCQQVNIPGIQLGAPEQANPFVSVPIPGEMLTYDQFTIQFLVDEYMCNYKSVVDWIRGLGFPEDNQQYTDMLEEHDQFAASELVKNYSDGFLEILDSNNLACKRINFKDMFPISIEGLSFESTVSDVTYLVGQATFRFTDWEFENDNCCP